MGKNIQPNITKKNNNTNKGKLILRNSRYHKTLFDIPNYTDFHYRAKQLDEEDKWIKSRRGNSIEYDISKISQRQRREYQSLFSVLDQQHIGSIRTQSFHDILTKTGANITTREFENALKLSKIHDVDNLNFRDFMSILYILEHVNKTKTLISEHVKHWWRSNILKKVRKDDFLDENQIFFLHEYLGQEGHGVPQNATSVNTRRRLDKVLASMKYRPKLEYASDEEINPRPKTADYRRLRSNELKSIRTPLKPIKKINVKKKAKKEFRKKTYQIQNNFIPFQRAKKANILAYECNLGNSYRNFYIPGTRSEVSLLTPMKLNTSKSLPTLSRNDEKIKNLLSLGKKIDHFPMIS